MLARRLYLDVIGLPPSPTEIAEFEKANAADSKAAISELVERLLKNERHGEKWARHWLDVARYSDSNGYERDYPREQWAWRDWVVRAINEDMPYDRFVIEQIAGDLLPNHTQAQMVATGFLRNSMTNEEGAIIPEQFRMEEMFDRMDCVGKAVLGLTIQCAQCHSHKFDPVSHDEYFGVFAFLNNTFEARSPVFEAGQQEEIAAIQDGIRAAEERLRAARPQWREELRAWSDAVLKQQPGWTPLDAVELHSSDGMTHPTKEPGFSILTQGPMNTGAYSVIVAEPELAGVTGLRLEALPHRDLHFGGPGRGAHGTWAVSDFKVSVLKPGAKDYEDLKLVEATADFSMPQHPEPEEWSPRPKKSEDNLDGTVAQEKTVAKKVERLCGPAEFLIDGKLETSWRADRGPGRRNVPSAAVVRFAQALQLPSGTKMKVMIHLSGGQWPYGMQLGHVRVSLTTAPAPQAAPIEHAAILALQTPTEQRTPAEQATLFAAWRKSVPELKPFNDEIEAWWLKFPTAPTSVLHLKERDPFYQRETRLLDRGGWDKPNTPSRRTRPPPCIHFHRAQSRPARLCSLAGGRAFATGSACGGEPRLASHLRHGTRRDGGGFRHARTHAGTARFVGLARGRFHGARLEPAPPAAHHPHQCDVSTEFCRHPRRARARSSQSIPRARPSLPRGCGGRARPGAGHRWPAHAPQRRRAYVFPRAGERAGIQLCEAALLEAIARPGALSARALSLPQAFHARPDAQ